MNGTDRVLAFVREIAWRDLPAAVQHQAKRCLLDLLGALLAGTDTPVARLMADFAVEQCPGQEATILTTLQRASAVGAALANGFAGNALDIDDGYRRVKGHPGACVLPPLLAATELRGDLSGTEFLTNLVIGYEMGIRAGLIRHATSATYHSSGSWGAIPAAAVVGRVLGLEERPLREALGISEYHAPIAPMMKGIDVPCMGKDSIGWGAMVGMASALMARRGFTGIEPLYSDCPNPQWIESIGQEYEILNVYFKPYACCRWAQPAIAGALAINRDHRLQPEQIARIRVRTFGAATRLSRAHPRDTESAQYNLSYPVAAALLDGELGPRQILPPRIYDTAVLMLADRVEAELAPEYERAFPEKALADVEVILRDGRTVSAFGMQAPWEPPSALPSDSELESKFFRLAEPILSRQRAANLCRYVWQLDQQASVQGLLQLLQPSKPARA
ncbi:MAG: MmgE/PrpD family protein [Anaerolineae bacterium]